MNLLIRGLSILVVWVLIMDFDEIQAQPYGYSDIRTILDDTIVKDGFIEKYVFDLTNKRKGKRGQLRELKKYEKGQLVERKIVFSGRVETHYKYAYSTERHLVSVSELSASGSLRRKISISYENNHPESAETFPSFGNSFKTIFIHDSTGRILSEKIYELGYLYAIQSYSRIKDKYSESEYVFYQDTTMGFSRVDTLNKIISLMSNTLKIIRFNDSWEFKADTKIVQNNLKGNIELSVETYVDEKGIPVGVHEHYKYYTLIGQSRQLLIVKTTTSSDANLNSKVEYYYCPESVFWNK